MSLKFIEKESEHIWVLKNLYFVTVLDLLLALLFKFKINEKVYRLHAAVLKWIYYMYVIMGGKSFFNAISSSMIIAVNV